MLINDWLHEYDFPYEDFLIKYRDSLISNYFIRRKKQEITNNESLTDIAIEKEISDFLVPKIDKIVQDNYWVGDCLINLGLRVYIQDNFNYTSFYHKHVADPGSLVGVFYLDPPENGGELSFKLNIDGEPWILKPKSNKLYLFPNWIDHTPLPQKDNKPRICFNYAYGGNIRPIHKITGKQW
jgi:hypothetical protein